ncbi:MAG: TIR domain-containing protein [Candidatus Heimdallarchaeota archaeon]|nr:TIR domain-containing protein [Candidatus Heimdallarchaeota archaeon]
MVSTEKNKAPIIVTAKVLILGDSGVGKTSLLRRFKSRVFSPTESTHGAIVSRILVPYKKLQSDPSQYLKCEVELWDLAGQPDYNAANQIFLQEASAAMIVIDEANEDVLESLRFWIKFLQKNSIEVHNKLLVSARIDRGGSTLEETTIQDEARALGLSGFFRTSAKTGLGIDALREGIINSIDWSKLTRYVMPQSWQEFRFFIHMLKQSDKVIIPFEAIHQQFELQQFEKEEKISKEEIEKILMLMHDKGEIFILHPRQDTKFVLTQLDLLYQYGSSIVLAVRTNAKEFGEIDEASVLRADIDLRGINRLPVFEERIVLDSVVSFLVESGACYRKAGKLVFPSQIRGEGIKCFLSYNSADKTVAIQIGRRLLDKGIDVWLDKWEILAGESITSKIEEGIDNATAFIILMSRNSMKSKWVREELRIAIQRRFERPKFSLIPILLEDCNIPGFLRDYSYIDWRSPSEEDFQYLLQSLHGIKMEP